jgi:hypothetical protein
MAARDEFKPRPPVSYTGMEVAVDAAARALAPSRRVRFAMNSSFDT